MDREVYQDYVNILKEELIPAMGCTEPIAIAYAAAVARSTLGILPDKVVIKVSGNILKNVKSVIVPNTGGLKGIIAAAAAGIVAGREEKQLEVISQVSDSEIKQIQNYMEEVNFTVLESDTECVFDIDIKVSKDSHEAYVHINGYHTNIVEIHKDGVKVQCPDKKEEVKHITDRALLNVEQIIAFADEVKIEEVQEELSKQIAYNTAIAEEGLRGNWGANVGRILLSWGGNSVQNRAKAMAAAGSDARMNGCELPVVINSGSGNQGLTASLPVIVYAEELKSTEEMLYRALVVSNLVNIHLKTGIGRLSAYCGAISAGCGAGAGVMYLHGGSYNEIKHTIVNGLAINSGVICDGAKASCAAKIASAVEAGLFGMTMFQNESQFYSGDGLVGKGVEKTIDTISRLAREGMYETDKKIIQMMIEEI